MDPLFDLQDTGGEGDSASEDASESLAAPAVKPTWSLAQIVANLTSDGKWQASTIGFTFELSSSRSTLHALTDVERQAVRTAFALISDAVNLTFVEGGSPAGRIGFSLDDTAPDYEWGHTSSTRGSATRLTGASVVLNPDIVAMRDWSLGGFNVQSLMHEMLHALGLPHPGNYDANGSTITYAGSALYAQDTRQYTIMSYFRGDNSGADFIYDATGEIVSASTPLLHDIAALQSLYGANQSTRTGDTVYGFNSTAGRDAYDFTIDKMPIVSIWDAGGNDTLDLSGTNLPSRLDLQQGAFSDALSLTKNISIAFGANIENARGGGGNDSLTGNGLVNRLEGLAGDDTLSGGAGDDTLDGGVGNDQAVYSGASGSYSWTANADGSWTIRDSRAGGDGTDRLIGIETLRFSDQVIQLSANSAPPSSPSSLETAFLNILRYRPTSAADLAFVNGLAASVASGAATLDAAIHKIADQAIATTSVATMAYEFFTGKIPSQAGLDYLVSPSGGNANNLNGPYYQSFSVENRYINFSVNLGKLGEGRDGFAANYGGLSLFDATKKAYAVIFGAAPTDAKVHTILDTTVALGTGVMSRADYFAYYGQDGAAGIGTKAAMVGFLLVEAQKADVGVYALSDTAFLVDLADGAIYNVDVVGVYSQPNFALGLTA